MLTITIETRIVSGQLAAKRKMSHNEVVVFKAPISKK